MTSPQPVESSQLAAVLWDMDGTLVDTEPYWVAAEYALAADFGGEWTEHLARQLVGSDLLRSGHVIVETLRLPITPEQVVQRLLADVVARVEREIPWRPGARELLLALRADGVPCALVTMSYRSFVDPIVAALPPGTFDVVVTGDEVHRGKPDPEPYLTAAASLGLEPGACVAIEDSVPGVESAERAGCTVVVVPNYVSVEPGPRRVFWESLTGTTPSDLARARLG